MSALIANIIVYGAMILIWIIVVFPNLQKLRSLGDEFENESEKLIRDEEHVACLSNYLMGQSDEFPWNDLKLTKQNFVEYADELRTARQRNDAVSFVDVTDYFNVNYIDRITHANLCDLVPGAMTSLGLLGTFMGLVVGISGFNAKNSATIVTGVGNLLGGMSTAFLTSIIGIIAALIFSFMHKFFYNDCIKQMEIFVVLFHKGNFDGSNSKLENKLLAHEEQQTNIMKSFAGVIAGAISTSMKTELVPVFEKMKETTEEFVRFSSKEQKASLEKIVQGFLQHMNQSFDEQFKQLGITVGELSSQIRKSVGEICASQNEISEINQLSLRTVAEMNNFVTGMNDIRSSITKDATLISEKVERYAEIDEKRAQRILEAAVRVQEAAAATEESIRLTKQYCQEQLTNISEAACKHVDQANSAMKANADAAQEALDNGYRLSTEFVGAAHEEMAVLIELFKDDNDRLLELYSSLNKLLSKVYCDSENSINNIDNTLREVREHINKLADKAVNYVENSGENSQILMTGNMKDVVNLCKD